MILKGKATIKIYKHWYSRGIDQYTDIMLRTGIREICHEKDVDKCIDSAVKKELSSKGWGKDFSGWTDFEWTSELVVEHVSNWKMEKIIKELTGEQFKDEFGFYFNER